MGFVHFHESKYLVDRNGDPFYLVGINYAAGYICTNFWEDWRPDRIVQDLDQIAKLGFNGVRFPIQWETFEPGEGQYSEEMLGKLGWFLDRCLERGLYAMPWCLVGIATETYDVSWRNGRSFFLDESMIQAGENHLAHLAERFADHEALLCWDICDEPEWYSLWPNTDQLPFPTELFTKWVSRMAKALKKHDKNHMVTLGFGHIATGRYGMDLRACANELDFMVVTAYAYTDVESVGNPRPEYELLYHLDMNRRGRASFLCECPGWSMTEASEETIAHQYNTTCYSSWLHGSCGVMPWVFSFYDERIVTNQESVSLEIHPIEPWFGIVDEHRKLLKNGEALKAFAETMRSIHATDYALRIPRCAMIVPRGYHTAPMRKISENMMAVHAALCGADIPMDMVWWDELDPQCYPMAILSLTAGMTSTDWRLVSEYVHEGGTLLMLDIAPSIYFPRIAGAWLDGKELTRLPATMQFETALGDIEPGRVLDMPMPERNIRHRVKMDGGEVIARQADGAPALIRNAWGKGVVYAVLMNITSGLCQKTTAEWRQSDIFALLNAIADENGLARSSVCRDAGVETGVLFSESDALLVAVNHNGFDTEAEIELRDKTLRPVDAPVQDGCIRLALKAGEARILHMDKA